MRVDNSRLYQARTLLGSFLGVSAGYSSAYFYSSGLLLIPIAKDLHLSRGQATLALLVCSLTAAALAPFMGRAVDRFGARRIGLVSMIGLAASFVICAWATQGLTSLLVTSMVIALLGAGSSSVSFSRLVVDAFDSRRGLALAVMQTGAGLGAFIIPFILSSHLHAADWRGAYRLLAVIVVAAAILVAVLIRIPRSQATAERATAPPPLGGVASVLLTRPFLILAATFVLAANAIAAAVVHFVPMMVDGGMSSARAGQLASLLGITLIVGRLSTGWLLDRLVPEFVAAALFLVASAGLAMLALGGADVAVPGALVVGLAIGSEVDLLCYLTARHFPRDRYGTAYGALFGLFLFGSAIGPAIMGGLYDRDGNYQLAFMLAASVLVIAAFLVIALRRLCPALPAHDDYSVGQRRLDKETMQ